ncbi:DUF2252 domain-containing protein [Leucobacter sp. Z1108]|uniref:DUF2252 domain-containing protein n=2 Tax=Leucobacter sp. Z1108 TaxID=3439066 RepID=UPI003F347336
MPTRAQNAAMPFETSATNPIDRAVDSPHFVPAVPNERWHPLDSVAERLEAGRRLRSRVPRRSVAQMTAGRRDPLAILDEQNATRVPELVPLRAERMAASPFAFYRGTAAIMAADLAADVHSGIVMPAGGDAHVANFGFYASPQQTLVFDLNDFDEAAWAPWDWDLKRLITSVIIAGQATGRSEEATSAAALGAVRAYSVTLRASTRLSPRARYYQHFDAAAGLESLEPESARALRRAIRQAKRRTGERAAKKLTTVDPSGRLRFVEHPPTMVRSDPEMQQRVHHHFRRYLESANTDIRLLMRNYAVSDFARRVVGVGSVGTRCALLLLQDGDQHPLILQSKEANRSVLEQYGKIPQPRVLRETVTEHGQGGRVVAMQRILQSVSDPFLGYLRGEGVDVYVRQFHDMKGGIDAETLEDEPFLTYAQACAVTLARAHSQSPFSVIASGYVGGGRALGEALLEWGHAYAALSHADYEKFVAVAGAAPTAAASTATTAPMHTP